MTSLAQRRRPGVVNEGVFSPASTSLQSLFDFPDTLGLPIFEYSDAVGTVTLSSCKKANVHSRANEDAIEFSSPCLLDYLSGQTAGLVSILDQYWCCQIKSTSDFGASKGLSAPKLQSVQGSPECLVLNISARITPVFFSVAKLWTKPGMTYRANWDRV